SIEGELASAHEQTEAADAEAQRLEALQLELETAVLAASEELRNCENQASFARQQIASQQATIDHERQRSAELEEEAAGHGRNLLAMSDQAGDARSRLKSAEAELATSTAAQRSAIEALSLREAELDRLARDHEAARRAAESLRQQYVASLQQTATL